MDIESFVIGMKFGTKSGGGSGGNDWALIGEDEFEISTTSTTATEVGTVDFGAVTDQDIIIIHIRDTAGKRNLYFYGSDGFAVVGHRTTLSSVPFMYSRYNNGYTDYSTSNGAYGVYPSSLDFTNRQVVISAKYHGTYSTKIDGTYKVEIYKVTPPFTMFE